MKKEEKRRKNILSYIALSLLPLLMIFLSIWLGLSYLTMKSDSPYVALMIDFKGNPLAEKVKADFPKKEKNSLTYSFPVILEQYTETDDEYTFVGIPYNYSFYYESRDEVRFEYTLPKSKGQLDSTGIGPNAPLVISLKYRLENNFESFKDYSLCALKKFYSGLFKLSSPCTDGNCLVQRDVIEWSVETKDKDSVAKAEYFNNYDIDALIRGLFNFYITDDLGYFKGDSFKLRSTQGSMLDDRFTFDSVFVEPSGVLPGDSSTTMWMLSGISGIYSKTYTQYDDIDLIAYMETVSSLASEEFTQMYLVCQMGYDTVQNLEGCNSSSCENIKKFAYNQCKESLETSLSLYDSYIEEYHGYHDTGSGNVFLWTLPSEMIYFNKIVEALNLNSPRYSKNDIVSYNTKAEALDEQRQTVVVDCHLLKNAEEMYSVYKDVTYLNKADKIISGLPNFEDLCDGIVRDGFCSLPISRKIVCADAIMYRDRGVALDIIYDLFYRHYFESPSSFPLTAYESFRRDYPRSDTEGTLLDEYGYLSTRREIGGSDEGLSISLLSDMIDSYYFINLLFKNINEK